MGTAIENRRCLSPVSRFPRFPQRLYDHYRSSRSPQMVRACAALECVQLAAAFLLARLLAKVLTGSTIPSQQAGGAQSGSKLHALHSFAPIAAATKALPFPRVSTFCERQTNTARRAAPPVEGSLIWPSIQGCSTKLSISQRRNAHFGG